MLFGSTATPGGRKELKQLQALVEMSKPFHVRHIHTKEVSITWLCLGTQGPHLEGYLVQLQATQIAQTMEHLIQIRTLQATAPCTY